MEGIDNIVLQETEDTKRAGGNPGDLATEHRDNDDGDLPAYVRFSRPYVFEEETFDGIDMSCLEGISTRDMMEIEKRFYRFGITSMNPENTLAYAKLVMQKASGLPIEFFEGLPAKEMMKIKGKVVSFFYS